MKQNWTSDLAASSTTDGAAMEDDELWEEVARPLKRRRLDGELPSLPRGCRVCPACQPLFEGTKGKWKRFAMCPHRWKEEKRFGKVKKQKKEKKLVTVSVCFSALL